MDKVDVLYSLGLWINIHLSNHTINLSLFSTYVSVFTSQLLTVFFVCLFAALSVYTILHRKNTILTLDAVRALEERLVEDDRILINKFE